MKLKVIKQIHRRTSIFLFALIIIQTYKDESSTESFTFSFSGDKETKNLSLCDS